MKKISMMIVTAGIFLLAISFKQPITTKTTLNDWGEWTVISSAYPGIEGRVKKGDYNEYAKKYYWYFQFRNRYNKQVEFNYGYKPRSESYNCSPDHRKDLEPGETSDTTGDLLDEDYKVRVCIGDVEFTN